MAVKNIQGQQIACHKHESITTNYNSTNTITTETIHKVKLPSGEMRSITLFLSPDLIVIRYGSEYPLKKIIAYKIL